MGGGWVVLGGWWMGCLVGGGRLVGGWVEVLVGCGEGGGMGEWMGWLVGWLIGWLVID